MNENLKAKITRRLDGLSDEIGRQILDYMEFLDSKYNLSRRAPSTVQRIAEGIEDRIGGVRIADVAAKGSAQVADAAGRVMEGLAAAGRAVAEELTPQPTGEQEAEETAAEPTGEDTEEQKTDA